MHGVRVYRLPCMLSCLVLLWYYDAVVCRLRRSEINHGYLLEKELLVVPPGVLDLYGVLRIQYRHAPGIPMMYGCRAAEVFSELDY